jgi:hypothetical protein
MIANAISVELFIRAIESLFPFPLTAPVSSSETRPQVFREGDDDDHFG